MKSITDNTPLMATLLKYAQFWLAFNNLTVKIEALGKEEALKPEMVEALDTFQKIMKTWREAITQGGGHIGNVMIERPFEKNAVRFIGDERLSAIVEKVNAELSEQFPLAAELSVSQLDGTHYLALITNHTLIDQVIAKIDESPELRGILLKSDYTDIQPHCRIVCNLNSEKQVEDFLRMYGK